MSFSNTPYPHTEPHGCKVQIPRLPQKRKEPPAPIAPFNKSHRVSRACQTCRLRKVKCNGGVPKCQNCHDSIEVCVYASSRKDRLKTATNHNQDMIVLLLELHAQVSSDEQRRIDTLLSAVTNDVTDAAATVQESSSRPLDQVDDEQVPTHAHVSVDLSISPDRDTVDEGVIQEKEIRADNRLATLETQPLLTLCRDDAEQDGEEGPFGPSLPNREAPKERLAVPTHPQGSPVEPMHTRNIDHHLDDDATDLNFTVAPLEMPPFYMAERLLLAYMESCHNTFPFLAKKAFLNEFYHYYAALARGTPYQPRQKWQAMVNLVFAIGAVYSRLISADWCANERDHFTYHARAVALCLQDPWWTIRSDLLQMQIAGLLSFYYLSIGRINRAWIMIGFAMRFAYGLRLHMRNEDSNIGLARKEILTRIWWAHFVFERLLSAMIGRLSQGMDRSASVPLPLPMKSADIDGAIIQSRFGDRLKVSTYLLPQQKQMMGSQSPVSLSSPDSSTSGRDIANSGIYLKAMVQLCGITQRALQFYDSSTDIGPWQSVQATIASLNKELETWARSLPVGLDLSTTSVEQQYLRERNSLDILYHDARILVNRPCLCRLDRGIEHPMASSNSFDKNAAAICVTSAQAIASHLADDMAKHVAAIYTCTPWWNMVHVIMQSLAVFLIELASRTRDRQDLVPSLKKLVRWLRAMGTDNTGARRAYSTVFVLTKKVAAACQLDIADLIYEDEETTKTTNISPSRTSRGTRAPDIPTALTSQPPADFLSGADEFADNLHYRHSGANSPARPGSPMQESLAQSSGLWDAPEQEFLGLFYTKFDERTPLPGFGARTN